jgi:hypothetical protein
MSKVRDYVSAAKVSFKLAARGAYSDILARQLAHDWYQEIRLAAWEAQTRRLGLKAARRHFGRCAYRALCNMGFKKYGTFVCREVRLSQLLA